MWTRDKVIYDILTEALGNKNYLQSFIDSFKDQFNKLETPGFPFRPEMQVDFSFEQIEQEYGITAMATYVDLDSPGTPINYEPISLQTGKIPRMKKRADFDEQQYRQRLLLAVVNRKLSAQRLLLDVNKKLIDSHTNSLTFQRHQMVSTGQFELTETNNAGGITGRLFKASIPSANIKKLSGTERWWTNDDHTTEGSASDPVKNLKDIAEVPYDRGLNMHWEVDKPTLRRTLNHSKVKALIGSILLPMGTADQQMAQANIQPEAKLLEILNTLVIYPINVIDSISKVDKTNPKTKKVEGIEMRSFSPDVWALVPKGNIGEILTVAPLKIDPSDRTAYAEYYGGRLLMTYDYDLLKKVQYIETEMTSLVIPDKPKYMYILNVK